MALEKQFIINSIEILNPHKHINVWATTVILEDGVELSSKESAYTVNVGDYARAKEMGIETEAKSAWTPEVLAAWQELVDNLQN